MSDGMSWGEKFIAVMVIILFIVLIWFVLFDVAFASATDYHPGDQGKIWITLAQNGVPQNNATCITQVFNPGNTIFLNYTPMVFLEDGIYYKDLVIPNTTGVYPVEVKCSGQSILTLGNASSATRVLGAGTGTTSDLNTIDENEYTMNENVGDGHRIAAVFNYSGFNFSSSQFTEISVDITYERPRLGTDPVSDPINIGLFNHNTSEYDFFPSRFSYTAASDDPGTSDEYTFTNNVGNYISTSGQVSVFINDTAGAGDTASTVMHIDRLIIHTHESIPNQSIDLISSGAEIHVVAPVIAQNLTGITCDNNLTIITQNITVNLTTLNVTVNSTTVFLGVAPNETNATGNGNVNGFFQFDSNAILWVIYIILLVVGLILIKKAPLVILLFGMYSIIFAFVVASGFLGLTAFIVWLIIAGLGAMLGYVGYAVNN